MKHLLVVLLLLAAALAGCTANDDLDADGNGMNGGDDEDGEGEQDDVLAGRVAPEWAPGFSWRYTSGFGDFHMVVSGESGDDWVVDTPDAETAWFHFREEISFLGSIRKSDLAGSQGTNRVEYLQFPLEENKTWSTTWDGLPHEITVVEAGDVFRLEAHEEGALAISYTYDPAIAWISGFTFYGEDGEPTFTSSLSEHVTDWSGEIYRWDGELEYARAASAQYQGDSSLFTVEDGFTDVWIEFEWVCDADTGAVHLEIFPLVPGASQTRLVPECDEQMEVITMDPSTGEWIVNFQFFGAPSASFELEVWSRAMETLQVPL